MKRDTNRVATMLAIVAMVATTVMGASSAAAASAPVWKHALFLQFHQRMFGIFPGKVPLKAIAQYLGTATVYDEQTWQGTPLPVYALRDQSDVRQVALKTPAGYIEASSVGIDTVLGPPVLRDVAERAPGADALRTAVNVVAAMENDLNRGHSAEGVRLLYQTAPRDASSKELERLWARFRYRAQTFHIGSPYIVRSWESAPIQWRFSRSEKSRAYATLFSFAITVPVYYGNNLKQPVFYHLVANPSGRYLVAFDWLTGFEVQDYPGQRVPVTRPLT